MILRACFVLSIVALSLLGQTTARETPVSDDALAPMRRMLASQKQFQADLERRASAITQHAKQELSSPVTWEPLREKRREELRDMLGLLPWPTRTPLQVQQTGTLDKGSYVIEKIAFQSLPGIYVTGNLYLPKEPKGKTPAIVYVCGHSHSPSGNKAIYQRHGISFAKNGYIAFILDSIQVSETFAMHHGVYNQEMFDWYARGYTPAGVEVWNAMRAIDYLETRPEVDADRIGMTGISGGAAMSFFTSAVDTRIKVVVPAMGISTYEANVKNDTQQGHCDCMFCINVHKHDMLHQGGLIAPRPLLMMHGRKDVLFPVEGYKTFEGAMDDLYGGYGTATSFRNIEVDTEHKDSDFLREQAIRWFDQHLMRIAPRKLDMDYSNAPPETVAVFGGKPPADAQNFRVHETFTAGEAATEFTTLAAWQQRRNTLLNTVNTLLPYDDKDTNSPDVRIPDAAKQGPKLPVMLYVASDGESPEYQRLLLAGQPDGNKLHRIVVTPRGIGETPWPRMFERDALRNAMYVGETVDSLRLQDVRRAFRQIQNLPGVDPKRITLVGRKSSSILALYAAVLEPDALQVILMDPPTSHREAPIFLNILRHTELPEAAALLAPRKLLFYGRIPADYAYTQRIYALHDSTDGMSLTMQLTMAATGQYGHAASTGY